MLAATLGLAAELGPDAVTMEGIAKRAAVSKDTLYRWWRSKTEVVLEALATYGEQAIPVPHSGSLEADLRRFMRATARAADHPTCQLLRVVAAGAAADRVFAEIVRDRFLSRRRGALEQILANAVKRGELPRGLTTTILDLVFGSLWYRLIFDAGPLDQGWADATTAVIASAARSSGHRG